MLIWTLYGIPRELIILVYDDVLQRLTLVYVATTQLFKKGWAVGLFLTPLLE